MPIYTCILLDYGYIYLCNELILSIEFKFFQYITTFYNTNNNILLTYTILI